MINVSPEPRVMTVEGEVLALAKCGRGYFDSHISYIQNGSEKTVNMVLTYRILEYLGDDKIKAELIRYKSTDICGKN